MSSILDIHVPHNVSFEGRIIRYREEPIRLRLPNGVLVDDATVQLSLVADGDQKIIALAVRHAGLWYDAIVRPVKDLETDWQVYNSMVDSTVELEAHEVRDV